MGTISLYLSTTKYDKQNVCIFLWTYSRCLISEIDMLLVQIAPINTSPCVFWQYQSMLISPQRHGLYPHCLTGTVSQLGSNNTLWLLIFYFSKFKQADTRASCLGGQINMALHISWVPASTRFQKPLSCPKGIHIMSPWANEHDAAHLQGKIFPMNLIWCESAEWLPSSCIRKIQGVLIMPKGTGMIHPWSNDHDVHLQARTCFWVNWPSGCRIPPTARF